MRKLLAFLVLLLVSCATPQYKYTTETLYNRNYSYQQLDSILKAEQIDWIDSMPLKGSESKYYEYYYYKDSLVFRFIKNGDSIKVTKRINL